MKTAFLSLVFSVTPMFALAQSNFAFSFSAGLGGEVAPEYFGSDSYELDPTGAFDFGYLRLGRLEIGNPDPNAVTLGFHPRASFRIIGERDSSDFSELSGLEDVDLSIELGGGVGYRTDGFLAFADFRYGVVGHDSWVAELGADAIFRPSDDWTITVGPRALWGSDGYTSTYFGVTSAEAASSAFSAFSPGSGFVSAGIEVGATYRVSQDWSLESKLAWDRLTDDAADSPIVQDEDGFSLSLVLMRRFSFGR